MNNSSDEHQPLHALHGSVVTVVVGPRAQPFFVHEGRLRYISSYFKTMLSSSFSEAETKVVTLEDVDEAVFEIFECWLYTRRLCYSMTHGFPGFQLIKVFCFADRIHVPEIQNLVLDQLNNLKKEAFTSLLTVDTIVYAWDNTLEDSGLRKLLVDILVFAMRDSTMAVPMPDYPKDFLREALTSSVRNPHQQAAHNGTMQYDHYGNAVASNDVFRTTPSKYYVKVEGTFGSSGKIKRLFEGVSVTPASLIPVWEVAEDGEDTKDEDSWGIFTSKMKKKDKKKSKGKITPAIEYAFDQPTSTSPPPASN